MRTEPLDRRMRACRRDTLRSVRRIVFPSRRPIVISSRIRGTTVVFPSSSWMMSLNIAREVMPQLPDKPTFRYARVHDRGVGRARGVGVRQVSVEVPLPLPGVPDPRGPHLFGVELLDRDVR